MESQRFRVMGTSIIIEGNINDLKEWIEEIEEIENEAQLFVNGNFSDTKYAIEVAYQKYHDLDEDNWDSVH